MFFTNLSYSNILLVFVIEIHVYTVSMASQPCASIEKQTGLVGIIDHRMNSYRAIKSLITVFHQSFHFLFVELKQWWSQLKLYTSSAEIQRHSHSTPMMRNEPQKIVMVTEHFKSIIIISLLSFTHSPHAMWSSMCVRK